MIAPPSLNFLTHPRGLEIANSLCRAFWTDNGDGPSENGNWQGEFSLISHG